MKLIKSVAIDHFRSIQHEQTVEFGDFTSIVGLNNAGKSNLLRALNLFFSDHTDIGEGFNFNNDYNRHDLKSKKKSKDIKITVSFSLPESFNFRKSLKPVEELLQRKFSITKSWGREFIAPSFLLNGLPLDLGEMDKVRQFLALINYRYIPNRVLPIDIIRKEHPALRDAIVRRLAKRLGAQDEMFQKLKDTSEKLVEGMQKYFDSAVNVDGIRLDIPASWQDFVFAFGYKLSSGKIEVDDSAQGSGVQSLLMLQTLALIDKDYFQRFGWKQASIWTFEEPESSLHVSLEAEVSSYLSELSNDLDGRLQMLVTTHSDIVMQSSDTVVLATLERGRTKFENMSKRQGLIKSANMGISRYVHPLLAAPLDPLVLVEGKYDYIFLKQAFRLLAPNKDIRVSFLEQLDDVDGQTGGDGNLLKYLKSHRHQIPLRMKGAPVIILLDWENKGKVSEYKKLCDNESAYKVILWSEDACNPSLDENFKGIERHFSDRIVDATQEKEEFLGQTSSGKWKFTSADLGKFKKIAYDIVSKGLEPGDLEYVKEFLNELISDIDKISE